MAILVTGFAVQVVEPGAGVEGWCYSVGLLETVGHPDLVVIDMEPETQQELLGMLGRAIVAGESVTELLEAIDVELVPVHPKNLDGDLLVSWWRRNGRHPKEGEFLQALPGASWFCSCHANHCRRLDESVAVR